MTPKTSTTQKKATAKIKAVTQPINEDDILPPKRIKAEMLNLRMDEPTMDWLREVSKKKGLGASTLARMWVLERLSQEGPPSTGEWV